MKGSCCRGRRERCCLSAIHIHNLSFHLFFVLFSETQKIQKKRNYNHQFRYVALINQCSFCYSLKNPSPSQLVILLVIKNISPCALFSGKKNGPHSYSNVLNENTSEDVCPIRM